MINLRKNRIIIAVGFCFLSLISQVNILHSKIFYFIARVLLLSYKILYFITFQCCSFSVFPEIFTSFQGGFCLFLGYCFFISKILTDFSSSKKSKENRVFFCFFLFLSLFQLFSSDRAVHLVLGPRPEIEGVEGNAW